MRAIAGGRAPLRRTLYICAVSSIRCNPVLRVHYQQLRAHRKPPKGGIGRSHAQAALDSQRYHQNADVVGENVRRHGIGKKVVDSVSASKTNTVALGFQPTGTWVVVPFK